MGRRIIRKIREVLEGTHLVLKEAVASFLRDGDFDKSATMAFYGFLSLIPLLLLDVFVVSLVLRSSEGALEAVQSLTAQMLPFSNKVIVDEVFALSQKKAWGVVTMVVLLWSTTPLASALRGAFYGIFRAPRRAAFIKGIGLDVLAILLALALMVVLVAAKVVYSLVIRFLVQRLSLTMGVVEAVLPFVMTILFLAVVYRMFTPWRVKWRHLLLGSMVTSALFFAMGPFFSFIFKYNPNYGYTFGSLKAIYLVFIWVYYAFACFLFGSEVIANLSRKDALLVKRLFTQPGGKRRYPALFSRMADTRGAGDMVFRQGDTSTALYVVLTGSVELSRDGRPFRTMREGEYFGEMAMLLDAPRTMTATVAEPDTVLVTISQENFATVLRENPDIVFGILRELADRLRATDEQLSSHGGGG